MRFVFVLSLALVGCAYRTPPVRSPRALEIADVTVIEVDRPADPDTMRSVRQTLDAVLGSRPEGDAIDVRVVIEQRRGIEDSMRDDGIAALALFGAPFGLVTGHARVAVNVRIEREGSVYSSVGTGECYGSLYAPALRRALALALDDALH